MDNGSAIVVFPLGDKVYVNNADLLLDEGSRMLADVTCTMLVFDCSRVRTCDSCGLRFFLTMQRRAAAAGKRVVLYRPDTIFMQLLSDTNLTEVFTIATDLADLG